MMTAVAAGLLALTACDSSPVRAVLNEYEVFTQPPDETDSLDAEVVAKVLPGLETTHIRRVGSDGSAEFYAALFEDPETEPGQVPEQGLCFIVMDNGRDVAESACQPPDDLEVPIMKLHVDDATDPVEAFLLPDEATIEKMPPGWVQISPNVVVVSDAQNAQNEVSGILANRNEEFTLKRDS